MAGNEESVFAHAQALEDTQQRAAYLEQACAGDPDLRRNVESLLSAYHDGQFLESPAAVVDTVEETRGECPGTVIGPYRLLEQIGEGGFGFVYLAEQTAPVKRLVALKVLKPGMDSKQVLARFEAERQALALMDHPNIARVLDAGTTPEGRPYFVMELVKGVTITRYCDEHRLTPRQRLELFVGVCEAVQHAHHKGIIHRDLKPSNVLVALYDHKAVVKVIDFGVAKSIGTPLTEETLHTGFGAVIGTVEYMSPEQATLNQLDIDTRSDIYSLGVVLYELLAGNPPFSCEDMGTAGLLEMLRVIREQEPPRPSSKLSADRALATLAANRGTEPAKLIRLVRGELDWIVMTALEKDRSRRYETANSFALDVRRYLADEQVQACPPSMVYRFRKFTRRNSRAVLAVGVVILALIGGIIGTSWEAFRAEKLRQDANANLSKARTQTHRAEENFQNVLAAVDQWLKPAIDEDTPLEIREELSKIPEVVELMRIPLDRALKFFEDFVEQKRADPETRLERAWASVQIGHIHQRLARVADSSETPEKREKRLLERYAQGEAAYRESIALLETLIEEDPSDVRIRLDQARACGALGEVLGMHGTTLSARNPEEGKQKRKEMENAYLQARALCDNLTRDSLQREHRYQLALTYQQIADLSLHNDWVAVRRESISLLEKLVAESPAESSYAISLAASQRDLSLRLQTAKRLPEAESYRRAAVAVMERAVADNPGESRCLEALAESYQFLASQLRVAKRTPEAEVAYRSAVAASEKRAGTFQLSFRERAKPCTVYRSLAGVLKEMGRRDEAAVFYTRELRLMLNLRGEFPDRVSRQYIWILSAQNLGGNLSELGRPQEAEEAFRLAVSIAEDLIQKYPTFGPYSEQALGRARNNLGVFLMDTGRFKDAEHQLAQAIAIFTRLSSDRSVRHETGPAADNPEHLIDLATSTNNLGVLSTRAGRLKEANRAFSDAVSTLRKLRTEFKTEHPIHKMRHQWARSWYADNLAIYLMRLAHTLRDTNQFAEAETAYREAFAIRLKELPQDRYNAEQLAYLTTMVAEVQLRSGNDREVEKTLQEAAGAWEKLVNDADCRREFALVHHRLSLLHEKAGRKVEAEAARSQLLKHSPNIGVSLSQMARVQADIHIIRWYRDPQRALVLAKQAVERTPDNAEVWNALGIAHYRVGDWEGSLEPLKKSMQLRKDDGPNSLFLAVAHWQVGSKDEARKWYDSAVQWVEKHSETLPQGQLGELRRLRAEAAVLMGISLPWPVIEEWRAWQSFADAYAADGRWSEAVAEYGRVVAANPKDSQAWYRLGLLRLHTGDVNGYRKLCEDMVQHFSRTEDPYALHHVVWTCALSSNAVVDFQPLLHTAEKLAAENPGAWWHVNRLGTARYRAGRLDAAVEKLNEAVQVAGGEGKVRDWLILTMAHHRLGHAEEARKWLARAEQWKAEHAGGLFWAERLQLEVLHREAKRLIR